MADRDRVVKRVTEILNLCDPGTYSATLSARNKTRNAAAIADFVDEAGMDVLNAVGSSPNEYRGTLVDDVEIDESGILFGDDEDPHLGPLISVQITLWADGPVREGKPLDHRKIQSYRENPNNIYDPIAHDQKGSRLGGYYDLWENRFFFTGLQAFVQYIPTLIRDNFDGEVIPDILESTWICLAIGNAAKIGVGGYDASIIGSYGQRGQVNLEAFKMGGRQFAEVDDPEPNSVVHK